MFDRVVLPAIFAALGTFLVLTNMHVTIAQVMQSASYQIQSDSINVGGNDTASSSNYGIRSTIGEVGVGQVDSASYSIGGGYRQMQEVYIALSGATAVGMDAVIPGVTGGNAFGSTTVTVITDSPSGYALTIAADNAPAMQKGGDNIADYAPGDDPSFTFNVNGGQAFFGFSPEGVDIISRYKDNGAACGTGRSLDTPLRCWDGLSTEAQTIASVTSPNHPDGSTTTIQFQVGVGAQTNPVPGFYVATTTVTAFPL